MMMQRLFSFLVAGFLVAALLAIAADKPPEKLVFPTKMGNVTYDHAKHLERAKSDCKVCHDKLFQQSAKAPLNYKPVMHKTAETGKISCGACHVTGGAAFATAGNCTNNKCHVKG
jgi:c(7)-type cytochrome triheme protein